MSLRATVKAIPTMLRVNFSEVVAYRAEMLIWVLATTMPFINLALWSALAQSGPIVTDEGKDFSQGQITAYFLGTFITRQLTGAWAAWEMNMEIRSGKLSMRLLRPVHPLWGYAMENLAAIPMRILVSLPVLVIILVSVGMEGIPKTLTGWALTTLAMIGGWLISLFSNLAAGALALHMESSLKVMDVYLAVLFVFSGYIVPVDLFPAVVRQVVDVLPFRYHIGLPTELFIGMRSTEEALRLIAFQWIWVVALWLITMLVWRTGLRKFSAYGG